MRPPGLTTPQVQIRSSYVEHAWKITIRGGLLAWWGLFCLQDCFVGLEQLEKIHMNTRNQASLLEYCSVTVIGVIHFICPWF